MHEVETILLSVEELVGTTLDFDRLDLHAGGERILQDVAVLQVAELGLHESGALARLHVLEPNDLARLTVVLEEKSVLKISCCCHKKLSLIGLISCITGQIYGFASTIANF